LADRDPIGEGTAERGGALHVVALPIGNPDDITLRAVKVLKAADAVLSEDTRRTRALLSHLGIEARLERFDAHVEGGRTDGVVARLKQGANLALVSDAGTPAISDPGHRLVRAAWDAGVRVVPVPGASSLTAALSASGAGATGFVFHGFIPKADAARREFLAGLGRGTHVAFSPARDLTAIAADACQIPTVVRLVIGRELTKLHEAFYVGTPAEVAARLAEDDGAGLGEAVLVFEAEDRPPSDDEALVALRDALGAGMSARDASRLVADRLGMPRRAVYQLALSLAARP
jgi:16S rRNA (cytidine1402-2'-O)-methyltransferase